MQLYCSSRRWSDLRASIWSLSSNSPSFFLTRWRRFVPWNPLPRPSRRMTTMLKELTRTVVQSTWNCSVTTWPPGVPSLSQRVNRFSTSDQREASKQYHNTFTAVLYGFRYLLKTYWLNVIENCQGHISPQNKRKRKETRRKNKKKRNVIEKMSIILYMSYWSLNYMGH